MSRGPRRSIYDGGEEVSLPPETPRLDHSVEWVLGGLLLFAPAALGAVEAWSEMVVLLLAAALAVLLALRVVVGKQPLVWTWAYLPMALFVGLLALQLVPLPAAWVAAVSPETLRLKTQLLSDVPGSAEALGRRTTLSFYPHATAHDLRIVLAACVAFAAVVNVYRRPEQVRRLLITVAAVGAATALLAILQILTSAKEIYWSVYTPTRTNGGPFVNQNHFAQFMNLSIGAGLALLLLSLHEARRGGGGGEGEWGEAARRRQWAAWAGAMVVAGLIGVLMSMSRMGIVSMLVAVMVAGALMGLRRRDGEGTQGWLLAPILIAVFAALLWMGFDKVYDRLATLRHVEQADRGTRLQTVKDLGQVYRQFPLLGIGQGAHETFYPMIDTHHDLSLTTHVENDYAQVLEEVGRVGLALVLAFVAVVVANLVRGLRSPSGRTRAATTGLAFGLVAVLIHSSADFGQRLPAVAGLTAVICGLLVALGQGAGRLPSGSREEPEELAAAGGWAPGRWGGWAVAPLALAALGWALFGAVRSAGAESHANEALAAEMWLERNGWDGSEAEYDRLVSEFGQAAALDPRNVQYKHRAAVARWRRITRETDPDTGDLLLSEKDLADVKRVVADLHAARALCPTYGANAGMAGQIERFVLNDPAGADHIRLGYRLSPADPTSCFAAGLLDAVEQRWPDAVAKFKRVADRMFPQVLEVLVHQVNRPDLALAVAGEDPDRLFQLAQRLQTVGGGNEDAAAAALAMAQSARAQAVERLKASADAPGATPAVLASAAAVALDESRPAAAVAYYRKALDSDYGNVGWRLGLARALKESGQVPEAIKEVQIVLRLRPGYEPARRLLQDLNVLPGAAGGGPVASEDGLKR